MNEQDRERIRTAIDVLDALRTGMAVVANTTGVSEVDDLALEAWTAVRRAHELYQELINQSQGVSGETVPLQGEAGPESGGRQQLHGDDVSPYLPPLTSQPEAVSA